MAVQLPKHIIDALKNGKTSLGDHPCFPPENEDKFVVSIMKKRFEKLSEETDGFTTDELKTKLNKYITQAQQIEEREKGALENICKGLMNDLFHIPQDTIHIEPHLVNSVDTSKERLRPESTDDFEFEDIDSINKLTSNIYKRRMLNALIAGASAFYANNVSLYEDVLSSINPELTLLYKKINLCNDYLLITEQDVFDEKNKKYTDAGTVEVYVNGEQTQPKIDSFGITFPVMLAETIKGLLEVACMHGLPDSQKDAEFVIKKADFKLAENWDLRLGYPLWEQIVKCFDSININPLELGLNVFFMELASFDYDDFNDFLKEVFANTKKGKNLLLELTEEIEENFERDDFDNYMTDKASEFNQLNDSVDEYQYFTPEELSDDTDELINEELLTERFGCDVVYHFTPFSHILSILQSNSLIGNRENRNTKQDKKGKYLSYGVSFSRTFNPMRGYPSQFKGNTIRLCFDTAKLNSRYHIEPFSFFSTETTSAKAFDTDPYKWKTQKNEKYHFTNNEYEDRLFLPRDVRNLENIDEYLISIDIPFDAVMKSTNISLAEILEEKDRWGNKFLFFITENDFIYKKNPLTIEEILEKYPTLRTTPEEFINAHKDEILQLHIGDSIENCCTVIGETLYGEKIINITFMKKPYIYIPSKNKLIQADSPNVYYNTILSYYDNDGYQILEMPTKNVYIFNPYIKSVKDECIIYEPNDASVLHALLSNGNIIENEALVYMIDGLGVEKGIEYYNTGVTPESFFEEHKKQIIQAHPFDFCGTPFASVTFRTDNDEIGICLTLFKDNLIYIPSTNELLKVDNSRTYYNNIITYVDKDGIRHLIYPTKGIHIKGIRIFNSYVKNCLEFQSPDGDIQVITSTGLLFENNDGKFLSMVDSIGFEKAIKYYDYYLNGITPEKVINSHIKELLQLEPRNYTSDGDIWVINRTNDNVVIFSLTMNNKRYIYLPSKNDFIPIDEYEILCDGNIIGFENQNDFNFYLVLPKKDIFIKIAYIYSYGDDYVYFREKGGERKYITQDGTIMTEDEWNNKNNNYGNLGESLAHKIMSIIKESVNTNLDAYELIDALKNEGDFYYWFISPFDRHGMHLHVANSSEIQEEIFSDIIDSNNVEVSHDLDNDYYLTNHCPEGFVAYKICGIPNQRDYYVILTNIE